jgi:hypothetical protein
MSFDINNGKVRKKIFQPGRVRGWGSINNVSYDPLMIFGGLKYD